MSGLPVREPPLRETSPLQRHLWQVGGVAAQVRGLRITGELDRDRLTAAITKVAGQMEILAAGIRLDDGVPVMVPIADGPSVRRTSLDDPADLHHERCVALLREDRDGMSDGGAPLVRFHVVELDDRETVLGLVAHPVLLDLHAIYLVLGAVMLDYFGRFRTEAYPPFAELAATDPVPTAAARCCRSQWWLRRLHRWRAGTPAVVARAGRTESVDLVLGEDRWRRLHELGGSGGNTGSLAVIALLAWWLRTRAGTSRPLVFGSTLDLRDYLGLGPVVGPLTDRVVFEVDLDGFTGLSFRDLLLRSHAGLLDSVVHYLPYHEIAAHGAAAVWHIAVNYCRLPPASAYTRGEADLASRGLSIELFAESALARSGLPAEAHTDLHVAESVDGMALVANFDATATDPDVVSGMLREFDHAIDRVLADPRTAVGDL